MKVPDNVASVDLGGPALLATLAESDVVDEAAIAAAHVLQVECIVAVVVADDRMHSESFIPCD